MPTREGHLYCCTWREHAPYTLTLTPHLVGGRGVAVDLLRLAGNVEGEGQLGRVRAGIARLYDAPHHLDVNAAPDTNTTKGVGGVMQLLERDDGIDLV